MLFDLALNYVYDAEKAAQNGKRVVWTPGFTECAFIYACDAIPLAFTEAGRIGSPEVLSIADNYFQVPRETCPMIKVNIAEWHQRRNGHIKKILACSADCEPFSIMVDIMRQEGYDLGWSEGISQAIKSLEQTLGFSAKEAMDVLLVPKEERKKYLKSNEPEQGS